MVTLSVEVMLSRPALSTSNLRSSLRRAAHRLSQLPMNSGYEYGKKWLLTVVEAPMKAMRTVLGWRWNGTGGPRKP